MNVLSIEPCGEEDEVEIRIDGRDLTRIVREVEQPLADAEGHPDVAGSYAGPPIDAVARPSRHLFGERHPKVPDFSYGEPGRVTLLRCGDCRLWDCWQLTVHIQVGEDQVTWNNFKQPGRSNWDLSSVGRFVFDRRQYVSVLESLSEVQPPHDV